jgi:hypothetical protein
MKKNPFNICFGILAGLHVLLFWVLPLVLPLSFKNQVNLFSVNTLPWWPLHAAGLPVTDYGVVIFPNVLGWLWCLFVWVAVYLALARIVTQLAFGSKGRDGKGSAS